jgi:hypothetical protein
VSWDIFIMDLPADATSVREIPEDFKPNPLGQRSHLIRSILQVAPTADFSDPSWGRLDTDSLSIEISMGDSQIVDSIALHVRGGDPAAGAVADIITHLELRAVDSSTGDFFDPAAAVESLRAWRAFRDRAIGQNGRRIH